MNKQKIKAFFHDPVDKVFNIIQHKNKAEEYFKIINENENLFVPNIEESDHIASAADRLNFPKDSEIKVDFNKKAELTHPLGSERLNLVETDYINADYKEIERVIIEAIKKIKEKSKDEKSLLLNLWRNLPDNFLPFEFEKFKLGNLWSLLPADTRIPDHSIFDHNWMSAAIAGSLPTPSFLKFSMGPVQSFISTAKRTEDYWMGSFLLSYLISKAIEVIIDEIGPEHIIFPYIKGQPLINKYLAEKYGITLENQSDIKIPSLSNIIFAILPYDKSKEIAVKMKQNVNNDWKKLAGEIKNIIPQFQNSKINEIWNTQIESFVETYYTIYKWNKTSDKIKEQYQKIFNLPPEIIEGEYPNNPGTYWQPMYKILDSAFNSRKNLRNFNQLSAKDELVKCSLCGEREALRTDNINSTKELTEFWRKIYELNTCKYKIDPKGRDKLCAVCFTKRMAGELYFKKKVFEKNEEINYPSLSTIAALPFKIKIIENWEKTFCLIQNYNELLKQMEIEKNFNWKNLVRHIRVKILYKYFENKPNEFREFADFLSYDGQWLYEENFTQKALEDYGIKFNKNTVNGILEAIKKIKEAVKEKPSKYLSIISMDADKMGEWLSGTHPEWPKWKDVLHSDALSLINEETLNKKRNLSPAVHSFISKCLNNFSLRLVKDIVEFEFPGKLIYSGGDDVLALMPVEYTLDAVEKIRFTFSGQLDEKRNIDLNHKNGYVVLKKDNAKEVISTVGHKVTMSAGIVITHIKNDLTDIIRHTKEAEHKAKESGRNSFCLKIIRGSGGITEYTSNWLDNNKRIIEAINKVILEIDKKETGNGLSMSFFGSFVSELSQLPAAPGSELIKLLLKRQLERHLKLEKLNGEPDEDRKKRKKEKVKQLQELLGILINSSSKILIDNSSEKNSFCYLLLIIRFLSSGGER